MIPVQRAVLAPWRGVVCVTSSQVGKTDSIANIMGAKLDDDPVPMLYMAPTRKFVEQTWEPRFVDMVHSSASLNGKWTEDRSSTKTVKMIAGVKVSFAWAGSATSIAGEPAGLVVVDERDRMGGDIEGEGDPVSLANARHSTYADGKTFVFSTPLVGTVQVYRHPDTKLEHWKVGAKEEISSPTWMLWQRGTRHEWMVPCPHCETHFAPRLRHLRWPKDCSPNDILDEQVVLACPHCGAEITESHKSAMNDRGIDVAPGQWVEHNALLGTPPRADWYTLWISGLCSPWRRWCDNAREYARALADGDSSATQTVVNTRFGELYSVSGEAPPWSDVTGLRLDYQLFTPEALEDRSLPDGCAMLFLTVDVQQDRLYYVVRGWSVRRRMESWLIDHGEIEGATNEQEVWDALEEFKTRRYGMQGRMIERAFIDQKFRTQYVFQFCRKHKNWAFPLVGRLPRDNTPDAQLPLRSTSIEIDANGKMLKGGEGGIMRWTANTDFFKRWIHDRIQLGAKGKGYYHRASDTSEDYCKQLVAEARVVTAAGRATWVLISRANHYLDCEMMQVACAYSRRLQHYAQPRVQQKRDDALGDAETVEAPAPPPKSRPRHRLPTRNWVKQW